MISGIHISTSEMIIQKGDAKKNLSNFIKGQTLLAKVINWSPEGKAQLFINGKTITAKTPMMLKPGQEIELKVIQEKDSVILKLVGPTQKITTSQISSLVSFFSKNGSIPDITGSRMENVKTILHDIALKSGKADKDFLPKLIEKSGMMWEKKVAVGVQTDKPPAVIKAGLDQLLTQDVKANILRETMAPGQGPIGSDGGKASAIFLETLESFQLLNQNTSESGRFLLPFPVFSENTFQFGQLLIDTGGKSKKGGKDSDKVVRISFLLNMTKLGPLRADFSVLKKSITGRFLLQDEDTCKYVNSKLPELKQKLSGMDYQIHQMECSVARNEEILESSLIETLLKKGDDQVLNIIV